jgi:hypothetical protein
MTNANTTVNADDRRNDPDIVASLATSNEKIGRRLLGAKSFNHGAQAVLEAFFAANPSEGNFPADSADHDNTPSRREPHLV